VIITTFRETRALASSRAIGRHALVAAPLFRLRPRTLRSRKTSLVDVTLDRAQRAAIALSPSLPLLVLGEAGHGKTTVLVHRAANILDANRGARGVLLVPTEGLARLLVPILRRLGVDIDVLTFDAFVSRQGRRSFRRLPPESELTPPGVMRFKRSAALLRALDVVASGHRGAARRRDLLHLFGDRVLVEGVAREARLHAQIVDEVLDRTRVQFNKTTEAEWSHVTDRTRLRAVDRRLLDDGTATAHADTIDVEDYPVLFEIDRRRAGSVAPRAYDLVAIDEAQELAPLELALMGRSVAPGGTLVVSGDADQHTDETSSFSGWDEAMRLLGAPDHATASLEIGYRCPAEVVALARAVRDGACPPSASVTSFADDESLVAAIAPELVSILERDRRAAIGILCRHPFTARRLAARLKGVVPSRLVFDGRFLPRGPAQITLTSEVKGLELDYVLVPDAGERDYPDDAASRRSLYVALTRARHQAVLACVGARSSIFAT
jgi:DNA helicase IV